MTLTCTDPTAQAIAAAFAATPEVMAVALAGSRTVGTIDPTSDYDLYIYADVEIPVTVRREIGARFADLLEIDNRYWEPGDEWRNSADGLHVDIMYRSRQWIEEQLERILVRHEASVGFSTCFWYNVRTSASLFDRAGWFAALQARAAAPYPEPLRRAIVLKNRPILRDTHSSYVYQLTSALARRDWVSVNHRVAALLASYFDILFAVNRLPHPGEKRLLAFATQHCALLPAGMVGRVEALLTAAGGDGGAVLSAVHTLLDGLDALLTAEGF